jgi:hypothetical protein
VILHLRPSNPKDFDLKDRGKIQNVLYLKRPNTKSFAFVTYTSKYFRSYVRAPTRTLKSLTAVLCDRLLSCEPPMQNLLHSRSCVYANSCVPTTTTNHNCSKLHKIFSILNLLHPTAHKPYASFEFQVRTIDKADQKKVCASSRRMQKKCTQGS